MEKEIRSFVFEINKPDEKLQGELFEKEKRKMVGHAAVFGQEAIIESKEGTFREMVEPGAFKESIRKDDVLALFNHDPNIVLGRNKSGTLKLSEDEKGLRIDIDPPDTQQARDLAVSVGRGDISGMSFSFNVPKGGDEWTLDKKGLPLRRIKTAKIFDVSPVTMPAYSGTDIAMRSLDLWKKQQPPEESTIIIEPLDTLFEQQQLTRRF